MRHHQQQEDVVEDQQAGLGPGVVDQRQHHQDTDLVGADVAEHPAPEPPELPQPQGAEVPPPAEAEAHPAQRRQQAAGLHHDPQQRAPADQGDPARVHLGRQDRLGAVDEQVQGEGADHHEVVEDRRPHRRGEVAAGVQHRGQQPGHAVEEDGRQDQVRQGGDQAGRRAARDPCQQRGAGDRERGGGSQRQHGQRHQPLGVRLAAARLPLAGAHQHRHQDAGEDATEQQLVDHAREPLGGGVGVADQGAAERRRDDHGTEEPGDPADDAAQRHHGTVAGDVAVLVRGPPAAVGVLRPGHRGQLDHLLRLGGAARVLAAVDPAAPPVRGGAARGGRTVRARGRGQVAGWTRRFGHAPDLSGWRSRPGATAGIGERRSGGAATGARAGALR